MIDSCKCKRRRGQLRPYFVHIDCSKNQMANEIRIRNEIADAFIGRLIFVNIIFIARLSHQ